MDWQIPIMLYSKPVDNQQEADLIEAQDFVIDENQGAYVVGYTVNESASKRLGLLISIQK
jgi:hypothetical protein